MRWIPKPTSCVFSPLRLQAISKEKEKKNGVGYGVGSSLILLPWRGCKSCLLKTPLAWNLLLNPSSLLVMVKSSGLACTWVIGKTAIAAFRRLQGQLCSDMFFSSMVFYWEKKCPLSDNLMLEIINFQLTAFSFGFAGSLKWTGWSVTPCIWGIILSKSSWLS